MTKYSPVIAALVVALSASDLQAQTRAAEPVVISHTPAIDRSLIRGIVFQSPSGSPVAGAAVTLTGTGLGNVTDMLGRFYIQLADSQPSYRVHIQALGYYAVDTVIARSREGGIAISIPMQPRPVDLDCIRNYAPLNVSVRDILSGGIPRVPVKLVVRNSRSADSATAEATATQVSLIISAGAYRFDARNEIELTAPGYLPWRSIVEHDLCGVPRADPLNVWLVPDRSYDK